MLLLVSLLLVISKQFEGIWSKSNSSAANKVSTRDDDCSLFANCVHVFVCACVLFFFLVAPQHIRSVIQLGLMNCCEQDWVYLFAGTVWMVCNIFVTRYWTNENYSDVNDCGLKWARNTYVHYSCWIMAAAPVKSVFTSIHSNVFARILFEMATMAT